MDLHEKRARWSRMLVQAAHFADLENTLDALARARACQKEIAAELLETVDPEVRVSLERELYRASRRVTTYEQLHEEWQAGVRARHEDYVAKEQAHYSGPLPNKGLD